MLPVHQICVTSPITCHHLSSPEAVVITPLSPSLSSFSPLSLLLSPFLSSFPSSRRGHNHDDAQPSRGAGRCARRDRASSRRERAPLRLINQNPRKTQKPSAQLQVKMSIQHHQPPLAAGSNFTGTLKHSPSSFRRNLSVASKLKPVFTSVESFAPATVANLGPGFDFLGCAISGIGDYVTLTIDPNVQPGRISIAEITGIHNPCKKLSKNPMWNCAGIAAISVMRKLKIRSVGLSLSVKTGIPLRSGLGSSAASAAAAAVALNEMFGGKLPESDLVLSALDAEAKLSGYHADNVAPAIMGGFVLIRSYDPLELIRLTSPMEKNLCFVLVSPEFEAQTKRMRAVLPGEIAVSDHVWNCSQAGALVAGVLQGDVVGFGKALSADRIVEPRRGALIPGMEGVKRAALEAGAYGCTISGSGPTVVAVTDDEERGREIGERMVEAFWENGRLRALAMVKKLDIIGTRVINTR